jgi:hypothetical protein
VKPTNKKKPKRRNIPLWTLGILAFVLIFGGGLSIGTLLVTPPAPVPTPPRAIYKFQFFHGSQLNDELWEMIKIGQYDRIIKFFDGYTNNKLVSEAILNETLKQGVVVTQGFSLCWGESNYMPKAYHENIEKGAVVSIDRGLFQLNNANRRKWSVDDFYDIKKNTHEGIATLKDDLLAYDDAQILGIAGFNAGKLNIVDGIRFLTLNHISHIVEYERDMEIDLNYFINDFINNWKMESVK